MIGSTASLPLHSAILQLGQNLSGHQTWNIQALSVVCALVMSLLCPTVLIAVFIRSRIHPYFHIKFVWRKSYLSRQWFNCPVFYTAPPVAHMLVDTTQSLCLCQDYFKLVKMHEIWGIHSGVMALLFLKFSWKHTWLPTSRYSPCPNRLSCLQRGQSVSDADSASEVGSWWTHFHHHQDLKYHFWLQFQCFCVSSRQST
jgi:hypothetical protein